MVANQALAESSVCVQLQGSQILTDVVGVVDAIDEAHVRGLAKGRRPARPRSVGWIACGAVTCPRTTGQALTCAQTIQ